MKLLKALTGSAENGTLFIAEVLQDDEARLWLVPHWRVHLAQPYRMPARIIRLLPDAIQWTPEQPEHDLLLVWPIPKPVLDGKAVVAEGIAYEVEEAPPIRIPLETRLAPVKRTR